MKMTQKCRIDDSFNMCRFVAVKELRGEKWKKCNSKLDFLENERGERERAATYLNSSDATEDADGEERY